MSGQSIDINKGFGGKYVWLIPNYSSSNINGAITIFYEVIPGGANTTPDLAKGAGGTFRYLKWQGQAYCPGDDFWFCPYVKEVKLWRNGSPKSSPPSGYDAMTTDINEARGGDYLYVVWKKS
ncbi:MAG: hypothetical protein M1833_004410 [Piccolia ochrophora]|nr:MAG: hypothetical protein M1833_004410 [Piccolia ochrophora]